MGWGKNYIFEMGFSIHEMGFLDFQKISNLHSKKLIYLCIFFKIHQFFLFFLNFGILEGKGGGGGLADGAPPRSPLALREAPPRGGGLTIFQFLTNFLFYFF